MKLGTSIGKLNEMKRLASGDPQKIAEYTRAQRQYDDTVAEYFNKEDGVKFYGAPSESYVLELEERAVNGSDRDKARAVIIRDCYEATEADKTFHNDIRIVKQYLVQRLENGEEITQSDLSTAHSVANLDSTVENRVLYTHVKREFENQGGNHNE